MIAELSHRVAERLPGEPRSLRPYFNTVYYLLNRRNTTDVVETEYGFEMEVDKSDFVQRRHITRAGIEEGLITFFYTKLREGEWNGDFVDIGACVGFHSLLFCEHGEGDVHAFEPLSYNVEKMRKNMRLNGYTDFNIYEYGLSSDRFVDNIYYYPYNRGDGSSIPNKKYGSFLRKSERAEFEKLDDEDGLSDTVDLVKIDVEGHELDVLRGGRRTITRQKPDLLMEIHPSQLEERNQTVHQLLSLVFELGYNGIYLVEEGVELTREEAIASVERVTNNHSIWCEF